ncbi:MAG TPA: metal ABC transporter permease, partial [Casimicrobiaceae bacterium]|nr:metal ABC transporter permease [Casimicrobiaceae bacterium]
TSALDSRSERAIQTELKIIARDHTSLTIAHRLSTIVDADEILVLDRGHIVERGTHVALLTANGVYARMWRLQQDERRQGNDEGELTVERPMPDVGQLPGLNEAPAAAAAATLRSGS